MEDWVGVLVGVFGFAITVISIWMTQSRLGDKVGALHSTMMANEEINKSDHDRLERRVKRLGRRGRKDRRRRRDDRQRLVRALVD